MPKLEPLLNVEIKYEHDVVLARQRARQVAGLLGLEAQDQVRVATAVSELARNAFQYAGGGRVEFFAEDGAPAQFHIRVSDKGAGIADLAAVLDGTYISRTGMGLGITGVRRLMDACHVESAAGGGTVVSCSKCLPKSAPEIRSEQLAAIGRALAAAPVAQDPFSEIQRQNQELLAAMGEVERQRAELAQLNRELEETNRGVVALYAELDERAVDLRRASDLKTQFLSNMTHEFRTPLNSILSISDILLQRMDGELTAEQEKQVGFIRNAARDLSVLVNDLLDLAKVEAGKVTVRPAPIDIAELFGMLRGMLKPLLEHNHSLALVFEEPHEITTMVSDEGKVSQILRNFISNALKYTPRGEVRVSAARSPGKTMTFSVADTGIGIAPEDQERIFEEFIQVEGAHQRKIKGTGLGLPLSRKLAHLLGGTVSVASRKDQGSVFSVTLPLRFSGSDEALLTPAAKTPEVQAAAAPALYLIIDDNETDRYVLKRLLSQSGIPADMVEAATGHAGWEQAKKINPDLIFLDLNMPGMEGAELLKELKKDELTRHIPVIIHTSQLLSEAEMGQLQPLAAAVMQKGQTHADHWRQLLAGLQNGEGGPIFTPSPVAGQYG